MMYDISAAHKEKFTPQWWGEMIWWTKFTFLAPWGFDFPPLHLDLLKDRHSSMRLVELHADKDPDAMKKFLEMTGNPADPASKHLKNTEEIDSTIIVVRNAFSLVQKDNMFLELNSKEGFRKHLRMDVNYTTMTFPNGKLYEYLNMPLGDIVDRLDDVDALTTITSDLTLHMTQPELWRDYLSFWKDLGIDFIGDIALDGKFVTQSFLSWGRRYRTRVHAAGITDHSIQVANSKRWRIINKRYIPYTGMVALVSGGLKTPEYFIEDYDGKLPYTEFVVHPGDILYFPFWHPHEVRAVHEDQLAFSFAVRKGAMKQRFLGEPVRPMAWFGVFSARFMRSRGKFKQFYADVDGCKSYADRQFSFSYNGSTITRFDMTEVDGDCIVAERELDYQHKELNGDYSIFSWHPRDGASYIMET